MAVNPKKAAAEAAASYVENGMVVGLGTGSTAEFAISAIGARVRDGLAITAIPTSLASDKQARAEGIPVIDFSESQTIDLTIDGADEVDPGFCLIKGGGGALLREKIVASVTRHQVIVVDESKWKDPLGQFPLPVEVVPFGHDVIRSRVEPLGCRVALRQADGSPFVTDNGNYILDCSFERIPNPGVLEEQILRMPGVVECGLFVNLTNRVITGKADGSVGERTL